MAGFIDSEVSVEDNTKEEDEFCDSDLDSLNSFTDDENDDIDNDRTFHQKFENMTNSVDDVLKEEYDKSITDIDKIDFCETSGEEIEKDDFKDTEKRIEKFKETLFSLSKNDGNNENYNYLVNIEQKIDLGRINELKEVIDNNLFDQLNQKNLI